jgi:3-hydroxyisobutyrate dehydrogenase-like beta-hydroxyacid dehydrogenase
MARYYNFSPSSGNANTLVAGSVIAGNAVFLGNNYKKVDALSALVSVTPATASLTFTAKWQVSNDNSTWVDFVTSTNAAGVALATGTATIVTKVLDAPVSIYGWQWARLALVTGGATGGTSDLYAIGYCGRLLTGAEGNLG